MNDVSPQPPRPEPEHLGDGVYAEFDGYHILLRANDHRSPHVIALEPPVMRSLEEYAKRCWRGW
jgi:hypothetical protein